MSTSTVCNIIYSPKNFPDAHSPPLPSETYEVVARHSDTVDELGAALMGATGLFSGWIAKGQKEDILKRLETGEKLSARVLDVDSFVWHAGGGVCWRGHAAVTIAS
ncbi:MAG: hypothetical protein M1812_006729 [Candelaria pacifica]|nr:MAG: hypothetical protein M1812_006729 [Candelaria pacifica]